MIKFGTISGTHAVCFQCLLPGSVERIWAYLTEPEYLSIWLASEAALDPRVGGALMLRFDVGEAPVRSDTGAVVRGLVTRYEPPYLLTCSWLDTSRDLPLARSLSLQSVVSFEVQAQVGNVLFTVTHRYLPTELLSKFSAGWHVHLSLLQARLRREEPEPLVPAFLDLLPRYERQVEEARARIG